MLRAYVASGRACYGDMLATINLDLDVDLGYNVGKRLCGLC